MAKKVAQHIVIMDMFKEIQNSAHDSLSIKEIMDLTGFKYGSVAGRLSELTTVHQFQTSGMGVNKTFKLLKENTHANGKCPRVSKGREVSAWIKRKALESNSSATIHKTLPTPPIPIAPKKEKSNSLVQRCYYLAKAHAHLTEIIVGDAFNISDEEASVLMVKVSHRYKDIKLKITLHC